MKNNFLGVVCMTLICAVLMLGIMGLYRLIAKSSGHFGEKTERHIFSTEENFELTDSRINP